MRGHGQPTASSYPGSWISNFRRRAKEGLLQAIGAHEATEDAEFDARLRQFTTHIDDLRRIKDAMELWLDSFDTFITATALIGHSFSVFFNNTESEKEDTFAQVSQSFAHIGSQLNNSGKPALKELFLERCLKPIQIIIGSTPPILELVKHRHTMLLDFDSFKGSDTHT